MLVAMRTPRLVLCALLALIVVSLGGCGGDDVGGEVDRARDRLEARVAKARQDFEQRRERYGQRIREVLDELERVFPRAQRTSPTVRSREATSPRRSMCS